MKLSISLLTILFAFSCTANAGLQDDNNPSHENEKLSLEGKGTDEDPYLISSVEELNLAVSLINAGEQGYSGAVYSQTCDLDKVTMVDHIGSMSESAFSGKYHGNGHKLNDVSFSEATNEEGQGIFGYTDGAFIDGVIVNGYTNPLKKRSHGVIVGYADATTISECSVSGTIQLDSPRSGAIAGFLGQGSVISGCTMDGALTSTAESVGGIAGAVDGGSRIVYCENTADITGLFNVGGIAGLTISSDSPAEVLNCVCSACTVKASSVDSGSRFVRIGGIVGGSDKSDVSVRNSCSVGVKLQCNASGELSGAGGIIGSLYGNGVVEVCYSTVTDSDFIAPNGNLSNNGAIVGYKYGTGKLESTNWYDSACSFGACPSQNHCRGIRTDDFTGGVLLELLNAEAPYVDNARVWIVDKDKYPVPRGVEVTKPELPKVIKVLAIGNSFTEDAVEQNLYELFKDAGIEAVIANCYIGGCTLETHWKNENSTSSKNTNSYRKIVDGVKTTTANVSIEYILKDEDWNYVVFQQGHGYYGLVDTHYPYLDNLIEYIAGYLKKGSYKVGYQMTWAFPDNTTSSYYAYYDNDQMKMYNATSGCAKTLKERSGLDLIIPTGTAIQNGRTTVMGDTFNRDWGHLEKTYGRYTAACTWFEAISGIDVRNIGYAPSSINGKVVTICRQIAHDAVKNPYEVTKQQ